MLILIILVMLIMNKKAERHFGPRMVLMMTFGVVLGALMIFFFIEMGREYATGEIYTNTFLARDLALTIDSMYAVPGNVMMTYKEDLNSKLFKIGENYVKIDPDDPDSTQYAYVSDREKLDYYFGDKENIFISKQGYDIILSDGQEEFRNTLTCTPMSVEVSRVLLEYSRNLEAVIGRGTETINIREFDFTRGVAQNLGGFIEMNIVNTGNIALEGRSLALKTFYVDGINYRVEDYQQDVQGYDLALSIHFGEEDDSLKNVAVAYVNDDAQTRSIACHILSEIMKKDIGLTNAVIKTVDGSRFDISDSLFPLSLGDNVILLEFGNIHARSDMNLYFEQSNVALGIKEGLNSVVS